MESPGQSSRWIHLTALLGLVITAANLVSFIHLHWVVDDAWISFRIARNGIEHGLLTFDTAYPPVEGMTNLLWTLLSAIWIGWLPEINPVVPARIVGAICLLLTVVHLGRLAARMSPERKGLAALVTTCLVAGCWSPAYWAMSGMETPLYGLLFSLCLSRMYAFWGGQKHAGWTCGLVLGLLAMTRPEGVLVGGMIGLGQLVWLRPWSWKRVGSLLIPFIGVVGAMEIFRWTTYGQLVPNTYWAKPPDPQAGFAYLGSFLLFGLGVVAPVSCWPSLRRSQLARLVAIIALVMAAGTTWTGGDWMPGFRRLTLPLLSVALLVGVSAGFANGRWRWIVGLGALLMMFSHLGAALGKKDHSFNRGQIWAKVGMLAQRTPDIQQVALTDIGHFGYHFRRSIFDFTGLTDAHIARLPGVHGSKRWDERYFRRRRPDLVLLDLTTRDGDDLEIKLRELEKAPLQSILVHGGYHLGTAVNLRTALVTGSISGDPEPALPARPYLLIFVRDGLELPMELWGKPPHSTWRELLRSAVLKRGPTRSSGPAQ